MRPLCFTFSAEGGEVNSFSTREKRGKTCVSTFQQCLVCCYSHMHACIEDRERGERGRGEGWRYHQNSQKVEGDQGLASDYQYTGNLAEAYCQSCLCTM